MKPATPDHQVVVLERENPAHVIYQSDEGAAAAATAKPDVSTTLLGPRKANVRDVA